MWKVIPWTREKEPVSESGLALMGANLWSSDGHSLDSISEEIYFGLV